MFKFHIHFPCLSVNDESSFIYFCSTGIQFLYKTIKFRNFEAFFKKTTIIVNLMAASKEEQLASVQSHIRGAVITATSLALIASTISYVYIPWNLPSMPLTSDRLVFTLQWNALSVGFILLLVMHIGNTRFFTSQSNPFSMVDLDRVDIHCRVLNNSVEQFLVSFVLQLVFTTWISKEQMKIIPIIVILFVVGRILFWRGYLNPAYGYTNRAYGLPLTVFPSVAMLGYCTYRLVLGII